MTQEQEQQFAAMVATRVISDTEHVLCAFTVYAAIKNHTDPATGKVTATEEDVTKWSNEYLKANKPLSEEEQNVLGAMAEGELPEEDSDSLLSLVNSGLGVHDTQLILIATTFTESAIALSEGITPAGQEILKGLAEGLELQTAAA